MKTSEYFIEWLAGKRESLQRSTYEAYSIYVTRHINPYFDALGKPMEEIKPLDIRGYTVEKRKKGLSAVSVRKHLNIIKQVFREAHLYELIERNPAEPVRLPKTESISDKARFISVEEGNAILAALFGTEFYLPVFITLYYGLRRSEVLGLRWGAVDFARHELHINHTVVKFATIEAKDATKTRSSRRTLPLLPEVERLLMSIPEEHAATAYIFHRENGEPIRPDTLTRGFQRALRRAGLPKMRYHDLRHATASILFDRGWSVADVQHWLGHSDIDTTRNIYITYNSRRAVNLGGTLEGLFAAPKNRQI